MHLLARKICAGIFFIVGLAVLASALPNAGLAPAWPQYGFDARHTLFNPFERTLNRLNVAELSLRWEYVTGNGTGIAPLSGPALADGVLYVGSYAETTFRALDAETGALRWMATCTRSQRVVWGRARRHGRCRSAHWEQTRLRPGPMGASTSVDTTV